MAHPLATWLQLTLTPGIGGETQRALLKRFGSPEQIYAASRSVLAAVVSEKAADRLLNADTSAAVDAALAWAGLPGSRILTLGDAEYPPQLLETPDPPTVLYVRGRVELLSRPCVAVVGSRNCTPQGAANAEAFARVLSEAGLTVVSGLALGIDAAAHRGALRGEGSTVAVIGTGPDRIYPARNRDLAHDVAGQGALVSEFPVGTPALAANFPRRNRVISGLARAVLVVEAAERSGSLITARLAADQGRDVFAIPGSIHSPLSKGCHRLIKQGAKLVDDARDVLDELGMLPSAPAGAPVGPAGATDPLLAQMGFDPCDVDALAERSGSAPEEIVAALLRLELDGWVASLPGGRYQRLR